MTIPTGVELLRRCYERDLELAKLQVKIDQVSRDVRETSEHVHRTCSQISHSIGYSSGYICGQLAAMGRRW